ncbi:MAG: hypothetical protein GY750_16635 [Lentisphaerae bacterium]|nr:hypothetical protein [Lentisphaerota bacterium]
MEPTGAADLGVVLDEQGRPYDVAADWGWQDGTVRVEEVADLFIPGGHVRTMDGNSLQVGPQFFADEAQAVEFGTRELLQLSVVLETGEYEGQTWESVLGVRLDVEGEVVVGWEPFEYAYGTDGGVGGITAQSVLDDPDRTGPDDMLFDWDYDNNWYLGDHDGVAGFDTFVFSNGFGDGGFPMSRGLNHDGEIAALLIWDTRYPWRLAIHDGLPPVDVTLREDQFLECMAGIRLIDQWGQCSTE